MSFGNFIGSGSESGIFASVSFVCVFVSLSVGTGFSIFGVETVINGLPVRTITEVVAT